MKNGKLSIREAETVAKFLSSKGQGKLSASACRWKTPEEIALDFLGQNANDKQVSALAAEIRQRVE